MLNVWEQNYFKWACIVSMAVNGTIKLKKQKKQQKNKPKISNEEKNEERDFEIIMKYSKISLNAKIC